MKSLERRAGDEHWKASLKLFWPATGSPFIARFVETRELDKSISMDSNTAVRRSSVLHDLPAAHGVADDMRSLRPARPRFARRTRVLLNRDGGDLSVSARREGQSLDGVGLVRDKFIRTTKPYHTTVDPGARTGRDSQPLEEVRRGRGKLFSPPKTDRRITQQEVVYRRNGARITVYVPTRRYSKVQGPRRSGIRSILAPARALLCGAAKLADAKNKAGMRTGIQASARFSPTCKPARSPRKSSSRAERN